MNISIFLKLKGVLYNKLLILNNEKNNTSSPCLFSKRNQFAKNSK